MKILRRLCFVFVFALLFAMVQNASPPTIAASSQDTAIEKANPQVDSIPVATVIAVEPTVHIIGYADRVTPTVERAVIRGPVKTLAGYRTILDKPPFVPSS